LLYARKNYLVCGPVVSVQPDKKTGLPPVLFDFSRKLRYFVERCSTESELNRKKNVGKHGLLPERLDF
jgi:hypothetical protein